MEDKRNRFGMLRCWYAQMVGIPAIDNLDFQIRTKKPIEVLLGIPREQADALSPPLRGLIDLYHPQKVLQVGEMDFYRFSIKENNLKSQLRPRF